ncbi:hypothetical protein [Paraburkholderia ginsengisoli]|uniref:Uncharacterized protein n=1 Tax=Paraburkholderia ginsengisoli TaxID=311231 RepID=A0A7T4TA22_9BURK|nr:hypothetical protein [Paraburkholderia ginsengisoli]QQC64865.1 hypothetical protein I6I06_05145 [Paraburkholderia ginsengisoli]
MKRSRWTTLTTVIAFTAAATTATVALAQTPKPASPDNNAPMIKPPEAASGSGGASNPDNMPIKRPRQPTNDRMTHEPPASGANAK